MMKVKHVPVRTVAAVAIVARPGTPPLPKPRINAMKVNVGSCPLGGRDVAKLTYSSMILFYDLIDRWKQSSLLSCLQIVYLNTLLC